MRDMTRLREALARRVHPLRIFFRDDDGGWADDRLACLCSLFHKQGLPLDIALIPQSMDERSCAVLRRLIARSPDLLHVHQHGFMHVNHQQQGRSAEFGHDRCLQDQVDDIAAGWQALQTQFGERIEAIFTPPWNRCSQDTIAALEMSGFVALSRIVRSDPLVTHQLVEVPVAIDWLKKRQGERLSWQAFCDYAAPLIESEPVVGIMLHHECMPDEDLVDLEQLIDLFVQTPGVEFTHLSALVSAGNEVRHSSDRRQA